SWNQYEGFTYPTHDILRSVNGGAFVSIAQISSNSTTYTDLNPPIGVLNYMVGIDIPNGCNPNKSIGSVISNKISLGTSSISSYLENNLEIYPNPSDGLFTIKLSNDLGINDLSFEIIDPIGKVIKTIQIDDAQTNTSFDLSEFTDGVYFIRLTEGNWLKQLILNR
uniref:T9SS type A sorting domain-containing protein n=1 Tax=Fluviicola sp. TaxID=1917219 RepID=UPI00404923E3